MGGKYFDRVNNEWSSGVWWCFMLWCCLIQGGGCCCVWLQAVLAPSRSGGRSTSSSCVFLHAGFAMCVAAAPRVAIEAPSCAHYDIMYVSSRFVSLRFVSKSFRFVFISQSIRFVSASFRVVLIPLRRPDLVAIGASTRSPSLHVLNLLFNLLDPGKQGGETG